MAASPAAHKPRICMLIPLLTLMLLLLGCINPADAGTGVCYGTRGQGLPTEQETVSLYKQLNIQRMRIYDPNQSTLQALDGSNIELMLGVPNEDLRSIASSQDAANSWVQQNVTSYPNVNFKYIVVGNEIRPNNGAAASAPLLLPAMQNMQAAVAQAGFGAQIKVSTAFDYGILSSSSPPSEGKFNDSIMSSFLDPILGFLQTNGAPLIVNVYPYFAYAYAEPPVIHLDYALFTAQQPVVSDGRLQYQNLFDAMVDALYWALEKADQRLIAVVVSESGWPTEGGKDTNTDNAGKYNNNLISHVKGGTPKRPGSELETYIFAMYDENLKDSDLEQHWGLYSNLQPKYPINF